MDIPNVKSELFESNILSDHNVFDMQVIITTYLNPLLAFDI